MADDHDDGFGDFTFAQPNPTVHLNSAMMNGHDSSAANVDDDDWGDFIFPGGLTHAVSLPRFPNNLGPIGLFPDQKVKNQDSEATQPGSAPGRFILGMDQWKEPTGALPLSIFGELEEEGESGAADVPSFGDGGASLFSSKNIDSVNEGSGVYVNDLIAKLYGKSDSKIESGPDLNRSNSVEEMTKTEKNSGSNMNGLNLGDIERNSKLQEPAFSWNWVNSNANGKVEPTLDSQGLNVDWDPLNLKPTGLNSDKGVAETKSISNGDNLGFGFEVGNEKLDNDDGWEFKDTQPKTREGEEISKTNQIKTENGPVSNLNGFSSTWDSLSFDFNGWNSNLNSVDSNTIFFDTGLVNQNGERAAAVEEEEEDGWEFKVADSKTQVGDDKKDDSIKNGLMLNFNGSGLSSDVFSLNSSELKPNGASSDEKQFNANLINKDSDIVDAWAFKDAEPDMKVTDGKPKDGLIKNEHLLNFNGSGLGWDVLSPDFTRLKPNGVSSDEKHFNANLIDEKDPDVAGAWTSKGMELDLKVTDREPKIWTENGLSLNPEGISFDRRTSSHVNGINSDKMQGNLNLFDNDEDFGGDDGWEFKTAASADRPGAGNTKDDVKIPKDLEEAKYTFGLGSGVHDPGDLFGASQRTSENLAELKSEFDFSSNDSGQNNTDIKLSFSPVDDRLGSVENFWASQDVFLKVGPKDKEETKVVEVSPTVEALVFESDVQESKVQMENAKSALPLSIFGDEENEADNPAINQDILIQMPTSNPRNATRKPQVDINDLISNLYSQPAQNTSVNHEQILNENALDSTSAGIGFNLASDNHDFDDDSWEFQDASLGAQDENVFNHRQSPTKYSTETELNYFVEFFFKMRDELEYIALQQLESLKKAQSAAAPTDDKMQALDKEIQELELELEDITSNEVFAENHSSGTICLKAFVEVLQEQKFQPFVSEYHLTEKMSLAENDCRSTVELLRCVALTVNILTSLSREDQSNYISAWSKMLSVCAQELRHGAFIWKQGTKENLHNQILSKPQGKEYVLALGEIYRVAEVLGSSARLYKPWILARSADSMCIFTLVSECSSLWSSSGLEEALQSILNSADFEYDESLKTLLDSIKYIKDLDALALYNHVFSGQSPTCQLSALTTGLVPGMKAVDWNGKHCFLTLANLWANLISSEPPNLPCIHVG